MKENGLFADRQTENIHKLNFNAANIYQKLN